MHACRCAHSRSRCPQANVPFSRLLKLNRPELAWTILGCAASALLGAQMPTFAIALSSVDGLFYEPVRAVGAGHARASRLHTPACAAARARLPHRPLSPSAASA